MKKRFFVLLVLIITFLLLLFPTNALAATYLWPVPGVTYISQYYSSSHVGLDIAASGDHEIVAAREGTVIAAYSTSCTHINNYPNACCNYGMGNYVQIKHSDGSYATYMHLRYGSVTVSKGQYVLRGTKIGMMGSSGNSTGQHLHFQVGYSSTNTINVNPNVLGYDYTIHTHSYSTYDHQGTEHPHYNYYKCSCGDVKENTSETNANLNCISCQNALVEVKKSTYENKFYYLFDEYLTWEQAKTYCETLGGHLATVNSEQEFDFLKNFVADGAKDSYLLGGTDIQTEGQWKWITDEPFVADAWQPWNDGEPNNGQGSYEEDYIEIYKATGKWNDFMGVSAKKTCGFICEFEADIPVKTMYYDDKKYSIYDISISWKDAETYCEALGGHLATVQDSGEELFLADLIQYGKKNSYWIGLHDSVNENQWQWVTGEDFIYSDWYEYQPDNSGEREHYVEIRKDFNNQWNDDTIDKFQRSALLSQGFICEFDKPMPIDVKVTKHKNSHELDINLYNNKEGKLLISAYRDDINIEIKEYALSEISDGITLNYSEIDGIKVLLWESLISLKPIMMKEIRASEFIDASKGIWVLKSNLPEGAEVIDTKYTYTLTSYAESAELQMDGWTLYDSEWKESSANSFKYANFPDGFDTNNSYYKTFKTSADSAYETDTEKRTVSTSHSGYIYWHWCRNSYTSGPINRWVEDAYKSTSNGNFFTLHSFDSTTNVTESDDESCYKYSNGNCCKDSYWYYKLPYYTCTTTDYTKIYKFKKTDDLESENYPSNENASNIQEWVCYIG